MTAKATRQTMTKFLKERAEDKIPDPFAALALEYLKIWASKGDYSAEMTDQDIERLLDFVRTEGASNLLETLSEAYELSAEL